MHGLLAFSGSAGLQALEACCVACKCSQSGQASLSIWFRHLQALPSIYEQKKLQATVFLDPTTYLPSSSIHHGLYATSVPFLSFTNDLSIEAYVYCLSLPHIATFAYPLLPRFDFLFPDPEASFIENVIGELSQQYSELVILGVDSSLGHLASKWIL